MNNTFRVSSLLRQKLLDLAVSPEAVLRHAGLPLGLFDQEKIYVATEELFALWDAIAAVSGDPGIGLKIGGEERIERYDPIAIASLYTRTFRDALERAARYKQLVCPEAIRLVASEEECAVRFSWLLAKQTEPPLLTDLCFAWIHGIGRRGTGGAVTPVRVEFQRAPAHRELYEAHFGCPVRFKAAHNALIFRKEDIERPFLTHNAEMLAMIAPQLESELACRQAQPSASDQVKAALKRVLAGKRPEIRSIAKELGQSARTLQRRLAEQGETYQSVLEAARRELARHYLLHSSLELNETAYLLGYEDANSFFRAFQKWEGMPPGRWRAGLRGGTSEEAPQPASPA
jgi:AraC-like DNA-binding protein